MSSPARLRRAVKLTTALSAAIVTAALTPALASAKTASSPDTNTGYYSVKKLTGAYKPITVNNLFPGSVDDSVAALSVTGSGAYKMPFAVTVYNLKMKTMNVSSNGNIQFFTNTDQYDNTCMPADFGDPSGAAGRALAVFWDDLYLDRSKGDGVFTQTTGVTGSRVYTIAWQGRLYANRASVAKASITFYENKKTIRMAYGTANAGAATIGVQLSTTWPKNKATQFACNNGGTPVKSGTILDFNHYL